MKDRYLQFEAFGYRPCKENFGELDKKFINFSFKTGRKEDEIKRIYEKFGSDEKVLKVKLEDLTELHKGQIIRFRNLAQLHELKERSGASIMIKDKVTIRWRKKNFSFG